MTEQDQIPGFELKRMISRSAIATTFEGYQSTLSRKVFLKKLHPQFAKDPDILARFKREAQICARIKHENLVDIYDYIASEDMIALVLEFVDGSSLADLLKTKGPFPVNVAISVLMGILKGLAYAHNKGVVHRDLKPENILISDEGIVKISDWGLSFSPELGVLTMQGMTMGTPAYMSPEAASGGQITFASDMFSLGVTVHEMFSGERLFQGANISEILRKVLSDSPVKLHDIREDVPPEIDRLVEKLLEKSPGRRFQNAEAVQQRLNEILKEHPMETGRQVIQQFVEGTTAATRIIPTSTEKIRFRKRRALIAGWILAVIILAIGLYVLRPSIEKPSQDSNVVTSTDTLNLPIVAIDSSVTTEDTALTKRILDTTTQLASSDIPTSIDQKPKQQSTQGEAIKDTIKALPVSPSPITTHDTTSDTVTELAHHEAIPRGTGYLFVTCDPWANIFINNRKIAQTPISQDIEVESGEIELALVNPDFPPIVRQIDIKPGMRERISISLWEYVGVINLNVRPWADIYVDGEYVDRTPLSKPLIVALGTHHLQLINPFFKTWNDTLIFEKGDDPLHLKVTLEPKD